MRWLATASIWIAVGATPAVTPLLAGEMVPACPNIAEGFGNNNGNNNIGSNNGNHNLSNNNGNNNIGSNMGNHNSSGAGDASAAGEIYESHIAGSPGAPLSVGSSEHPAPPCAGLEIQGYGFSNEFSAGGFVFSDFDAGALSLY